MLPPCIAAAPTQNEALHCIVMQHDLKSGQDNIIRSVYHCSELTCWQCQPILHQPMCVCARYLQPWNHYNQDDLEHALGRTWHIIHSQFCIALFSRDITHVVWPLNPVQVCPLETNSDQPVYSFSAKSLAMKCRTERDDEFSSLMMLQPFSRWDKSQETNWSCRYCRILVVGQFDNNPRSLHVRPCCGQAWQWNLLDKSIFKDQVLFGLSSAPRNNQDRFLPLGNTGITAQLLKPSQVLFRVDCLIDKLLTLVNVVSEHGADRFKVRVAVDSVGRLCYTRDLIAWVGQSFM